MRLLSFGEVKKKLQSILKDPVNLVILVIFIIGFLLRVLGVYPGYSPYHPDEGKAGYSSAWYMFINKTLDLPHYHYPALIPTVELFFLILVSLPILWMKLLFSNPDVVLSNLNNLPQVFDEFIVGRSDITIMYLSRYLTSIVGFLTVVVTFLIGRRLFNSRLIALLSITVLAVNMRAVSSSQLDLPDAYAGFFLLLAFYVSLKLKDHPVSKLYILSGVSVGLAISAKLQLFSLIPFIMVHLYYAFKAKGLGRKINTLISKKLFFAGLAMTIIMVLVNIGPLTHWEKFIETITRVSQLYGFGYNKFSLTGLSYFYHIILTPAVVLISLFGVAVGLLKYRLPTVLVLSIVIPYLYYFLFFTRGWFYPRNFVSVIPFFTILAGLGLASIWSPVNHYVKNRNFAIIFFIFIISLVLFESTKNSLVHTINYMKPWNIITMRACIRNNILEGKTVAAHPTDKYILFSLPSMDVDKKLNFIPLNFESSYSLSELQEEKADYALLGLDMLGDQNSVWWMTKTDFWQKPGIISNNVFVSLAAKELFISTVCSQVKPWQAVENNYVFSAVPPKINLNWRQISTEGFDKREAGFKKIDGFGGNGSNLVWDEEEGKNGLGALKIKAMIPTFPVVRWVSPVFIVEQGKAYKVEGWVKGAVNLEQKNRDGFLRLDFYQDEPKNWDEATDSLVTNLSPRYFGLSEWGKLEAIGVAPANATFATVSFQVSNFSISDFWLDDVMIYKSETEVKLPNTLYPEGKEVVDNDVFVPNLGSGY